MRTEERSEKHQRNKEVETCLKELEELLGPVALARQKEFTKATQPTVFIMGCARSGTTLVNQLLVKQLNCCYPSNFISRFYYAPYIGALLQKLMYDLDHSNELLSAQDTIPLSSILGKTKGALSPHEFWYFWRRHFQFGEYQKMDEHKIDASQAAEFAKGLYSIQGVFNKPLVMKGMIMNWNIPYLSNLIENSFFVFVERDLEYNAQSLLLARKDFFNDEQKWYSFLPEEFPLIKDKSPEEQVVAQVYYTNKAIKKGLAQLPADKHITINYSDFCKSPGDIGLILKNRLGISEKNVSETFAVQEERAVKVEEAKWKKIKEWSEQYKGMDK